MLPRRNIFLDFSYLLILAASLGGVVVLGALVAPTVFNSDDILAGILLDRYNQGIIMGQIFHKFSYWIYFVAGYVVLYEGVMYKYGNRDGWTLVSAFVVVFTSLLFSAVYSPKILAMQALGAEATQSDTFENLHFASELDFKILAVALLVLFVRRLMLLRIA